MIPGAFDYVKPTTVNDTLAALAEQGEDAKVIAGGQSLLPLLRLRLAYPSALVDIGAVDELRGVRVDGDRLVIGAMTTHHTVLTDPLVRQHASLLAAATAQVADPAVRHLGTFGGSLAHADPAADLPGSVLALDAELVIQGQSGRRTVPAAEFFVDYLETVLGPGDLLVEVRVPMLGDGWGFHYEKFNRVAQAYAIVGVAAAVRRANGSIAEARVGLTNMGPTPVRASATESALAGADASAEAIRSASRQADEGTAPPSDIGGQADYRRHLAQVLTGRAVMKAAGL